MNLKSSYVLYLGIGICAALGILQLTYYLQEKRRKSERIFSLIPQETPTRPANPLLTKAFEYIETEKIKPGIAIDFDPGYDGVEIAYLLKKRYTVVVVDKIRKCL